MPLKLYIFEAPWVEALLVMDLGHSDKANQNNRVRPGRELLMG